MLETSDLSSCNIGERCECGHAIEMEIVLILAGRTLYLSNIQIYFAGWFACVLDQRSSNCSPGRSSEKNGVKLYNIIKN